jgi:hypothetical protein
MRSQLVQYWEVTVSYLSRIFIEITMLYLFTLYFETFVSVTCRWLAPVYVGL